MFICLYIYIFLYLYIYICLYIFSFIALEGYIKSNFGPIYKTNLNKKIGCGSITDGYFKLEVHIINFEKDDYEFMKGDKIKVIGEMQYTSKKCLNIYYYYYY